MYIGKTPTVGNFQVCDAISVVNGQAAYTLQVGGTNVAPESANHMLVSLNGILQKPGSSFTISGSTMTFASNLATGDVIDFVQILGNVLDIGQPSDDTVTAAKLNNDIISGTTALTSEPAATDELLLSDAGTLKRIDYSLISNRPAFLANISSTQSLTNNTNTTVVFDNEVIDTDSGYDTSTGIFTVPTAGKYLIGAFVTLTATQSAAIYRAFISKNGTSTSVARADIRPGDSITFGSGFGENTPAVSAIVDLSASDTLRVIARIESGSGTLRVSDSSSNTASQFYAYKLTGI